MLLWCQLLVRNSQSNFRQVGHLDRHIQYSTSMRMVGKMEHSVETSRRDRAFRLLKNYSRAVFDLLIDRESILAYTVQYRALLTKSFAT
jgi:hypothetical protein